MEFREYRTPVSLCKGVEIDSAVYEISENRYLTLIIKGIIVYLITAGGMGAYLTAIDIDFNQVDFQCCYFYYSHYLCCTLSFLEIRESGISGVLCILCCDNDHI